MRLLAAIKRRQGKSIDKIANDLERSRHTVYSWICRFIDRGLEGAYSKHRQFRCCC
ncbi:MAG: helix-turn-helix domain-containing protein [Candidatus Aenigmarchaeota archaeon]|nr:helix-turn-helix domain-containing protein [Candidatus Aenigmarchaeota archaeon]